MARGDVERVWKEVREENYSTRVNVIHGYYTSLAIESRLPMLFT